MELMKLKEAPGIELWRLLSTTPKLYNNHKNLFIFSRRINSQQHSKKKQCYYLLVINQFCCIRISFNQLQGQGRMNILYVHMKYLYLFHMVFKSHFLDTNNKVQHTHNNIHTYNNALTTKPPPSLNVPTCTLLHHNDLVYKSEHEQHFKALTLHVTMHTQAIKATTTPYTYMLVCVPLF